MKNTWKVNRVGIIRDGGSTAITLENPKGRTQGLWFDYSIGSQTRGRLFALASNEASEDRHLLPLNSDEQHYWLAVLRQHVDSRFTVFEQEDLMQRAEACGHLFKDGETFTGDEHVYWLVLDRIRNLELLAMANEE